MAGDGSPSAVGFSPDGAMLFTRSARGSVLWAAGTWEQLGPRWEELIRAFTPDGAGIVAVGPSGPRVWPTPAPVRGTPERLMLWAQVMTGLGMDAGGKVYRIDDRQAGTPKWQERRDQLQKLGGPPATSSWRVGAADSAVPDQEQP
jgi:hypothetical protein